MKYSNLLTKTQKFAKEYDSTNASLLIKAGFVDQTMAGVYTFLPLGLRVLTKIENIVRKEMDKIGAELLMPSLSPKSFWETTGRLETIDVLFKAVGANKNSQAKNGAEYVLNCTHEDLITPIAQKFRTSYKDFPFAVYQIQTKFRNEARPKSGIMRGREFRMKDLYSFHTSQADFQAYYDRAKEVYTATFKALGLGADTHMTLASGGDFTKDFSHEFQTRCEAGEDVVFYDKKSNVYYNREVTPSRAPKVVETTSEMLERKDIEGKGVIGVGDVANFANIPIEKTTKTLLFEGDNGKLIAAAIRGGYEIDEEKLKKIVGTKKLVLASADTVRKTLHTEPGYVGVLNLPKEVEVYFDESCSNRMNFETGMCKTNYHVININFGRDLPEPEKFHDFKVAKEGDLHPESGDVYEVFKAAEVGNIFPLQSKFPDAYNYKFTDEHGKEQSVIMGSYGIGTSRVMGVMVEKFHDEKGIIWPKQVAPFTAHLISLRGGEDQAAALYTTLQDQGIDVLWDERDISAGSKFADADLIGCPVRLVVSAKTNGQVEWKERASQESEIVGEAEVLSRLLSL